MIFFESSNVIGDTINFDLTVEENNRPPAITNPTSKHQTLTQPQRLRGTTSFLDNFEDLDDGDRLSCVFSGVDNPNIIFRESSCSISTTENLGPGSYDIEIRARDTFDLDSDPIFVNLIVNDNSSPSLEFAYVSSSQTNTVPSDEEHRYRNGETILVDEGKTYYLHVVSKDPDNDLTILTIDDFEESPFRPQNQYLDFEKNGNEIRGITNPLSENDLDTEDNGNPFYSGSDETITVFELKPSYYHVQEQNQRDVTITFSTLKSKWSLDQSKTLSLLNSESLSLVIRTKNIDDMPIIDRSLIAPSTSYRRSSLHIRYSRKCCR